MGFEKIFGGGIAPSEGQKTFGKQKVSPEKPRSDTPDTRDKLELEMEAEELARLPEDKETLLRLKTIAENAQKMLKDGMDSHDLTTEDSFALAHLEGVKAKLEKLEAVAKNE